MNIVEAKDLVYAVPNKLLFDEISFCIAKGKRIWIIANNGSWKSSLLQVLAGKDHVVSGDIHIVSGVRIGYLSQHEHFPQEATVADVLFAHNSKKGQVIKAYEQALLQDDTECLVQLVQEIESLGAWEYETHVRIVINKLCVSTLLEQTIATCSWWELKRLALAKLLLEEPDLLLLDEPTNHLDIAMIEWLEWYLKRSSCTLVVVTHDRYFLDRLCDTIWELTHGNLYTYAWNYSHFLRAKMQREEIEQKHLHQMKQVVKKERAWLNKAPRARASKSIKREKACIALEKQYQSLKRSSFQQQQQIDIAIQEQRIWGKILTIHNISKYFGIRCIVDSFSYNFRKGERVALIGNNGVGKSTFINMLLGTEEVDSWTIKRGSTIRFWLYQQKQEVFDTSKRVIEIIKDVAEYMILANNIRLSASKLLERFLFDAKQQYQRAYTLSGWEKRRLHLLKILISNPNFLILDEPTNDLDIATLQVLEEFLLVYTWCLVLVSHDRYFVDKVVDHLLVFEGHGVINEFPGVYSDRVARQQETGKKVPDTTKQTKNQQQDIVSSLLKQQAQKKKSLSNKEREEYARLGTEIEGLEQRKEVINLALSSWKLDHSAIKEMSNELALLILKLEEYEERWLALAERE